VRSGGIAAISQGRSPSGSLALVGASEQADGAR